MKRPEASYHSIIPAEYVPYITGLQTTDPWLQQPSDAMVALVEASKAREHAVSWRAFFVGACGISLFDDTYSTHHVYGANQKPLVRGPVNTHAEQAVLRGARAKAIKTLSVLAVSGEPQLDIRSGLEAPTLLPCASICLPLLRSSALIAEETLLLSVTPDFRTVQAYSSQELAAAHRRQDMSGLMTMHFETADGKDDDEWASKFFQPLLARILGRLPDEVMPAT